MLEIGQYFRISQNGIDDKKSGTDGVVQSKNTIKNVNLSKTQNSKKKKKKVKTIFSRNSYFGSYNLFSPLLLPI